MALPQYISIRPIEMMSHTFLVLTWYGIDLASGTDLAVYVPIASIAAERRLRNRAHYYRRYSRGRR